MSAEHSGSALADAFVRPERKARLRSLLARAKGRAKLRVGLAHFRDLDQRYAHQVPSAAQTPEEIAALLRARGAPATCYVLSEQTEIDGRELPLEEALALVVGRGIGTFLSCIPGRLAYFEGEDAGARFILDHAG